MIFVSLLSFTDLSQVTFRTTPLGYQFHLDPLSIYDDIRSLTRCSMICSVMTDCQTVDFDYSLSRCRLFEQWFYEGTIQAASTSQVAYISPQMNFYSLYNQFCVVTKEDSRFLRCVNGRWTCQMNYYWNGTTCCRGRSFNQTCQTNNWCNRNLYLICLNVTMRCSCNHSMTWTGTKCTPSKGNHCFVINSKCQSRF